MAMRDNQTKPCGICSMVGHMINICPFFQDRGNYEQVNALGGFPRQKNFLGAPRPHNYPYSNTYNLGWKNHLNFSYANNHNPIALSMSYNKPFGFKQIKQPQAYQPPHHFKSHLLVKIRQ